MTTTRPWPDIIAADNAAGFDDDNRHWNERANEPQEQRNTIMLSPEDKEPRATATEMQNTIYGGNNG